ncbi:transcription factor UPBEAT1 [Salvia miltiorrhiza]|uniref:transcription factor UPBEAT1 n=1 Tax=Salvia miltiorrhiza TaxID=226208 RepID=UPI0025AB9D23|nr:transcription factor UPBEAT1 [Salvia miltiorrhiza]
MAAANSVLDDCELAMPLCRSRKLRSARCRNGGAAVMMRRAERRRRGSPRNAVERKVRTLKKLIPNCESMGVERLFRETAEYIVALQRRVKVMQTVVDALSSASDDE